MIKNNFVLKIILCICFIICIYSKQIEDPVARHDANMCGTYLCPGLPDLASKYIMSGCEKEFSEFINYEINNKEEIESKMELLIENDNENVGYSKLLLIILAIVSSLISSSCGYYIGKYECKKYKKTYHGLEEF